MLVILGGNPVFTAPADLKFAEKLAKVALNVYHGLYVDETANLCHWNVAEAHPLESWGDARAYDGTVTHHSAADRAAVRGPIGARGARRVHVAAGSARLSDRQGLLDAGVRRRRRLDDPRRRRAAVQGRRHVLAARPSRRVHRRHRDRRRRPGHAVHGSARRGVAAAPARRRRPPRPPVPPRPRRRRRYAAIAQRLRDATGSSPRRRLRPRAAAPAAQGRARDHLPARSDDLGRPLRQQRLAAGAAQAVDEDHVGHRRRGSARSSRGSAA